MGSLIYFSIPFTIQIIDWIVMYRRGLNKSLVLTLIIGGLSTFVFVTWFYENVLNNPCEGQSECMNETGMIFVFSFMGIIGSVVISGLLLIVHSLFKN